MRRKDREMPRAFGLDVFDRAEYGVVGFVDGDTPYTVPLSLVRQGESLYFHSAQAGRKVDLGRAGGLVSVTAVGEVEVPEFTSKEDLDKILADPQKHRLFGKLIYTTSFESVHAMGRIREVTDPAEKTEALRALCQKFTPDKMAYFDAAIAASLKITAIFAIDIETVKAKAKKVVPGQFSI